MLREQCSLSVLIATVCLVMLTFYFKSNIDLIEQKICLEILLFVLQFYLVLSILQGIPLHFPNAGRPLPFLYFFPMTKAYCNCIVYPIQSIDMQYSF